MLGRYDDWAAYTAVSKGQKICFALTKSTANSTHSLAYALVTTRPADKVFNEVSVIADYTVMRGLSGSALEIDGGRFAMYGQDNGYWISNQAEEPRLIDSIRRSSEITMRGQTAGGGAERYLLLVKGISEGP